MTEHTSGRPRQPPCQRVLPADPADRNHHRITALPYHPQEPLQHRPTLSASGTTAEPSARPPQPHRSHTDTTYHQTPTGSHTEPYNSTGDNDTSHTTQGTDRAIEQATLTAAISSPRSRPQSPQNHDRQPEHTQDTHSHRQPYKAIHAPITALLIHYPTITIHRTTTHSTTYQRQTFTALHYFSQAADRHSITRHSTTHKPPTGRHKPPLTASLTPHHRSLTSRLQSLAEPYNGNPEPSEHRPQPHTFRSGDRTTAEAIPRPDERSRTGVICYPYFFSSYPHEHRKYKQGLHPFFSPEIKKAAALLHLQKSKRPSPSPSPIIGKPRIYKEFRRKEAMHKNNLNFTNEIF